MTSCLYIYIWHICCCYKASARISIRSVFMKSKKAPQLRHTTVLSVLQWVSVMFVSVEQNFCTEVNISQCLLLIRDHTIRMYGETGVRSTDLGASLCGGNGTIHSIVASPTGKTLRHSWDRRPRRPENRPGFFGRGHVVSNNMGIPFLRSSARSIVAVPTGLS